MSDPGEFGRRLKYLRERDQVTMTRLASTTTMDKDRLRELEAGKAAPTPWERQRIAECFAVSPDYFTAPANPAAPSRPAGGGKRQGLDFSEFKYFKDTGGGPSTYDSGEAGNASTTIRVSEEAPAALPGDLFDDSDSISQPAHGKPAGGGEKAAPGGHGKSGAYVDPFASFRAAGPAGGPAAPQPRTRPADQVEPVSERRQKGGKSMRSKGKPAPQAAPDPSMTMGKAPGSRFAHTRGVTDDAVEAGPSEEPPSRGFRAVNAPPELLPEPPRPAPAHGHGHGHAHASTDTQRRTAPKAPAAPQTGLPAETEALLDAAFGGAGASAPATARHAPQPARPAQPSGTARYAPLPPDALARAAQEREAAATGSIDPKAAALEALVYVKAVTEILLARGLVTSEELAKALRRARGD